MLLPHGTVFAVVDGEKFELYRNAGMETEPRLTALNVPELDATNFSAGARLRDRGTRYQARTGDGSNDRADESAHVVAVIDWLNAQVLANNIEKLVVIADPRSLGEMRRRYHKKLEGALVGELPKTMTGRPANEIINALHG